jgi:hypothetical protein
VDADRQRRVYTQDELLRWGDAIAEILGVTLAKQEEGKTLTPSQRDVARDAILTWHQVRYSVSRGVAV